MPAVQASQGQDTLYRWSYVQYTADPGEVNHFTAEETPSGNLHLNDPGAIIRWLSIPGLSDCVGGVHDVLCLDRHGFDMGVTLGDGADTFVNQTRWPATVYARDGETDRISCGSAEAFDTVYADAQDVIETPAACEDVQLP